MRQGVFVILVMISGLACGQSPNSPPNDSVVKEHILTNEAPQITIKGSLNLLQQNELRSELKAHCGDGNYVVGPIVAYPEFVLFTINSTLLVGRAHGYILTACLTTGEYRPLINMSDLVSVCEAVNLNLPTEGVYQNQQALEGKVREVASQKLASMYGVKEDDVYVALYDLISYELKSSHADR